ncbi:MAG: hypothetical protein AAGC57_15410 [Pseudomonadota bacterium]
MTGPGRAGAITSVLVWAVVMAAVVWLSVHLSDGRLIYSIDDPYIHLALAETILDGGWGINPGEAASPSSSVLYAPLLSIFVALGLGESAPLAIGIGAAGLAVWLTNRRLWSETEGGSLFRLAATPLVILCLGAWSLPMMGMEHALHVLTVVAVLGGLVAAAETGRLPLGALIALVAMPLLRFEGVALAGTALVVLTVLGLWRPAVVAGLAIFAALLAYALVMRAHGLPVLPTPVTLKSDIAASVGDAGGLSGFVRGMVEQLKAALDDRRGTLLALGLCAVVGGALRTWRRGGPWRTPEMAMGTAAAAALAAHLLAGAYGWFGRYEVYAVAAALYALIYLYRRDLDAMMRHRRYAQQLALIGVLAVLAFPYARILAFTPTAARNVYEQQHQMHRLATEFLRAPVAVNDLGWVAYRNDHYVLDLWGLGSEEVRQLKAEGRFDAAAIDRLASEKSVAYAMLYEEWFEGLIPPHWCVVAVLGTDKVSAAHPTVEIYAVTKASEEPLRAALAALRPTLPARVRLEERACG